MRFRRRGWDRMKSWCRGRRGGGQKKVEKKKKEDEENIRTF